MKEFFSFEDGVKVSDWEINRWMKEMMEDLKNGKNNLMIASGDTVVHCWIDGSGTVNYHVCNSNGYSRLTCGTIEEPLPYIPYYRGI